MALGRLIGSYLIYPNLVAAKEFYGGEFAWRVRLYEVGEAVALGAAAGALSGSEGTGAAVAGSLYFLREAQHLAQAGYFAARRALARRALDRRVLSTMRMEMPSSW